LPGAKHDNSPSERAHTNFLVRCVSRLACAPIARLWRVRCISRPC